MQCLHKLPAGTSETENGLFWFCNQKPTCHFVCSEDEGYLFEKAIDAFHKTGQPQPKCCANNLTKLRVVKDMLKENYGRPFFACSKDANRCEYFEWGDEIILPKPPCYHNEECRKWTVKKEGPNKGKIFFRCPRKENEGRCKFFEWAIEKEEGDADKENIPPIQKDLEKKDYEKPPHRHKRKNALPFCSTQDTPNFISPPPDEKVSDVCDTLSMIYESGNN